MCLLTKSHNIFDDLGRILEMSRDAVYLSISRNMDKIFDEGEYATKTKPKKILKQDDDVDWNYRDLDGITLSLQLSQNEKWAFDLIEVVGKERAFTKLRDGWTDELAKIIESNEVPCVLSFKRAYIVHTEFSTVGKCKECKGTVRVESLGERSKLAISVEYGPDPHTNTNFRRLTKTRANEIRAKLEHSSVHNVYMDQAKELSMETANLPRNFVTKKSLENLKTNSNTQTSAIQALRLLKYQHPDSIHELATDPLCILFWTKEQKFYYSQLQNQCVSVDATGGLVKNISLITDINKTLGRDVRLPHIFLYLISVKTPNAASVPVGQMLSAQQDALRISYFLSRWLEDFGMPAEVVMDKSAALLKATSLSFAKCCSTKEYVLKCYDILNCKVSSVKVPFLRLDSSHLINNWHHNKILLKMDRKARQLYLCVLGFLMQCDDFDVASGIIEHVIVLINIPCIKDESHEKCPSCVSYEKLSKLVTTHEVGFLVDEEESLKIDDDDFDAVDTNENVLEEDFCDTEFSLFNSILGKIEHEHCIDIETSKSAKDGGVYYNPALNEFLKKLIDILPLWSGIMRKHSRSFMKLAVSNDTEARFNVIKNIVFDSLPTHPHVFVDRMLDEVTALAKLTRLEVKHKQNLLKIVSILFINPFYII